MLSLMDLAYDASLLGFHCADVSLLRGYLLILTLFPRLLRRLDTLSLGSTVFLIGKLDLALELGMGERWSHCILGN